MKTFEAFNNIDGKDLEEFFLKLSHLDELEIKFDLINHDSELFYFYRGECLFTNHKEIKQFWIYYDNFILRFEKKYKLKTKKSTTSLKEFLATMVEKYFGITGHDIITNYNFYANDINKIFNKI